MQRGCLNELVKKGLDHPEVLKISRKVDELLQRYHTFLSLSSSDVILQETDFPLQADNDIPGMMLPAEIK